MNWVDLAVTGLRLYALGDRAVTRGRYATRNLVCGFLGNALTDPELDRVTDALYATAGPVGRQGLFDWENRWFSRTLPGPPARLLIGACGYGRDALPLETEGYEVFAFEPEPAAVHACQKILKHGDRVFRARYDDLASGLKGHGPLGSIQRQRFDAAIFGWGSFGHLRHPDQRREALESMATLTEGPILLSFLEPPPTNSRLARVASTGGAWVARARDQARDTPRDLWFAPWCGFVARVPRTEVEGVARQLGRRTSWGPAGEYCHATLTLD